MATITQIIDRLDAKIYELINDPDSLVSYRLGDKRVERTEMLEALTKLRESYAARANEEPYEDIRKVAFDIDEFGEDESEWIGDDA